MLSKEEFKKKVEEVENYFGCSFTEVVMRLAKEPIVRHFKGGYYRVIGVGQDCNTEQATVIYTPLDGSRGVYWTRELVEFLEPVPDGREEQNVTKQKRRFEFIDSFAVQLDLIDTETLVAEVNKRVDDKLIIPNDNLISEDWVIARVLDSPETGRKDIYEVVNAFGSKEQAEDNLSRNKRRKKLMSEDYTVVHRIFHT